MDKFKSICPNCGAENEHVVNKCVFCKSPIIRDDNYFKRLSNEELLIKAHEWVNRVSLEKGYSYEDKTKGNIGKEITKFFNNGKIIIPHADVVIIANDYLNLLDIRALDHPTLLHQTAKLKATLILNKKKYLFSKFKLFIIIALVILFYIALMIFGDNLTDKSTKPEENRLKAATTEIQLKIDKADYQGALIQTEQIRWTYYPEQHSDKVNLYDKQREDLKESIKFLMMSK